jgi:hypothetical protein
MAYTVQSKKTGEAYFLHSREVTLRGGRKQMIFFFARTEKEGVLNDLPAGYEVMENSRTGLPMLRKAK